MTVVRNGLEMKTELKSISGDMYVMALMHDAESKIFTRSIGNLNENKTPNKNEDKKRHNIPLNNNPVNWGNMEYINLLLSNNIGSVKNFFDTMPKLRHTVEVTNPQTGVVSNVTLEGLQSFFA